MFKGISTLEEYKYIYARKEDEIVKITKRATCQDKDGNTMYMYESEYGAITCFSKSEVVDNIEDLMDEYVVDCKHKDSIEKHPFVYTLPKDINKYYLDLLQDIKEATIVYGAIWTGQGLKYVAKMNENGEWELI